MTHTLHNADWLMIGLYVAFAIGMGAYFTKKASESVSSFFVGSRNLPWWVAGTSMVATTFAADTPLAVTGIVATGGISGNWLWWSWAIAHLVATFFFARLWRRSGVITDAEITEIRYGGRPAASLRVFKALYFGIFINGLTMAWVIAAMVKISRAFFDVDPVVVIVVSMLVAVIYTTLGGFHSVVVTDLVQFALGMGGALVLAIIVTNHFGGIGALPDTSGEGSGLLLALHEALAKEGILTTSSVLEFLPSANHPTMPIAMFVVLLIAGWWRLAEGNGYIVQRLAACKDERHAEAASLWFAVAHNALRPWPWIIVGLAAFVIYPGSETLADREMAYPMMMGEFLPAGVLGLVIASLLAAFMSTIDTHTNWGASYLVSDIYKRFIKPDESDSHYVMMSRLAVVLLAIVAGFTALIITNIADVWRFLVTLGAGLGSVTAARWYWHRITPHAEFAAMGVTTLLAVGLQAFFSPKLFGAPNDLMIMEIASWLQITIIAAASIMTWVPVTLFGPQNAPETMRAFVAQVDPPGPGWAKWREPTDKVQNHMKLALFKTLLGLVTVYGGLFGIGHLILGSSLQGLIEIAAALGSAWLIWKLTPPSKEEDVLT
ncbi:Na+:solute symporter [Myxococcota bacterium]|nr:Na+:solute symporter [Myxococcota bacterium]